MDQCVNGRIRASVVLTRENIEWLDREAERQTASRSLILRQAVCRLQSESDQDKSTAGARND
jgi:hypothetical protein